MNLKSTDLNTILEPDSWWYGVANSWCKINSHVPHTKAEVKSQILWGNSCIRVGGQPSYNLRAIAHDILSIEHILNDAGTDILSSNILCEKFPQLTWLEWHSIKEAIPGNWRKILQSGEIEGPTKHVHKYAIIKSTRKPPSLSIDGLPRTLSC